MHYRILASFVVFFFSHVVSTNYLTAQSSKVAILTGYHMHFFERFGERTSFASLTSHSPYLSIEARILAKKKNPLIISSGFYINSIHYCIYKGIISNVTTNFIVSYKRYMWDLSLAGAKEISFKNKVDVRIKYGLGLLLNFHKNSFDASQSTFAGTTYYNNELDSVQYVIVNSNQRELTPTLNLQISATVFKQKKFDLFIFCNGTLGLLTTAFQTFDSINYFKHGFTIYDTTSYSTSNDNGIDVGIGIRFKKNAPNLQ